MGFLVWYNPYYLYGAKTKENFASNDIKNEVNYSNSIFLHKCLKSIETPTLVYSGKWCHAEKTHTPTWEKAEGFLLNIPPKRCTQAVNTLLICFGQQLPKKLLKTDFCLQNVDKFARVVYHIKYDKKLKR